MFDLLLRFNDDGEEASLSAAAQATAHTRLHCALDLAYFGLDLGRQLGTL